LWILPGNRIRIQIERDQNLLRSLAGDALATRTLRILLQFLDFDLTQAAAIDALLIVQVDR